MFLLPVMSIHNTIIYIANFFLDVTNFFLYFTNFSFMLLIFTFPALQYCIIRTDPRGVNLNRVYGNPSLELNPTIFAARKLILYAHLGRDVNDLATSSSSSRRSSGRLIVNTKNYFIKRNAILW